MARRPPDASLRDVSSTAIPTGSETQTATDLAPTDSAPKYVFDFAEGSRDMRDLLGGKGANICEMTRLLGADLVPAGFVITSEACVIHMSTGEEPPELAPQVDAALERLQGYVGRRFGDADDPLLLSVRSGSRESMPGMMDTVLNLGLNDRSVEGLARATGNDRFAWDCYRRFVQMFSNVVHGVSGEHIEDEIAEVKARHGVHLDTELDVDALRELTEIFKRDFERQTGEPFPQDPAVQLEQAILAVFDSWSGARAVSYRRINHIPDDWGTAVNVQQMVFGNKGEDSGSGVAFSRDEVTGGPEPSGDFLINAQGEDVVSGVRNAQELAELRDVMPEAYAQLTSILRKLEGHYGDIQDTEFTIEEGRLYMLQTRNAKRPAQAAVRFAVDAVAEELLTKAQAIATIDASSLDALLHPTFDPKTHYKVLTRGVAASPGAAKGTIVFNAPAAVAAGEAGHHVVLVRPFTEAEDVAGFFAAQGILTSEGGKASHAALVARGMGRPCVCGASALDIDLAAGTVTVGDVVLHEGDLIAINGSTGDITIDDVALVEPEMDPQLRDGAGLGRRAPHARRARQRGRARGRPARPRVRRRGNRPVPHRAHVHGGRPPAEDARDDHGLGGGRPTGRAGRAAAAPAGRLRGPVRGDGGPAGHDPAARPAAARVPAEPDRPARRAPRGARERPRRRPRARAHAEARAGAGGDQPDARHARMPARDPLPRDLRDAGRGDHARGARRARAQRAGAAHRGDDPAGQLRGRAHADARAGRPDR